MELSELLDALSSPAAYGLPPGAQIEVVQTHISVVFLVGDEVYKLKKPVHLEFLDYSTLEKRRRFAELEVSLNRRLAPRVYRGVLPVVRVEGGVRVGGEGEVVDWVVHMKRLPDAAQLGARVAAGEADEALLAHIGRRLARFHQGARRGPEIAAYTTAESFEAVCMRNFPHLEPLEFIDGQLVSRVRQALEAELARGREAIDRRARAGVARDGHGDIRLDHVYVFPESEPPDDLAIVDCIEFGEELRAVDPFSDLAFLVMDLHLEGCEALARALTEAYLARLAEGGPLGEPEPGLDELAEGRALLPLYTAYRATVRAKVDGLTARDPHVSPETRRRAEAGARRHLLLALRELSPRGEDPRLVVVAGLPGVGKTTLARVLVEDGYACVRSDEVRKRLAGLPPTASAAAPRGEGIYGEAWSDRVYAACRDEAEALLSRGERVVVDANFRTEARRAPFVELARELGVALRVVVCTAPEDVVRARLASRSGDASDADFDVYLRAREEWEPLGEATAAFATELDCAAPIDEMAAAIRRAARAASPVRGGRGSVARAR